MEYNVKFLPCGDSAVTVEFGNCIDEQINLAVHSFARRAAELDCVREVVPTYRSATVHYNAADVSLRELIAQLEPIAANLDLTQSSGETIEIPVLYGGEYGEDLSFVAAHNSITEREVIEIHSGAIYSVYMLGFTPGFPYLGGMSDKIAAPRLETPRVKIPAGSVGIAGSQTGVYPISSPGGWQLIGRTPINLFNLSAPDPFYIKAGQKIKFVPIDEAEFLRLSKEGELC